MALATVRMQELDGFVDGLFGEEDAIDLPERASRLLRLSARRVHCSLPWPNWLRTRQSPRQPGTCR